MANKGLCSTTANIMPDNIKTKLKGTLSYDIITSLGTSSGDGWFYSEPTVTHTSAVLLGTTEDFIGPATGAANLTTSDKFKWVCIKHTGTSNGSTLTNSGVVFTLDAGTAAYNVVDGIFLAPNEMVVLKCPNTTLAGLTAISVKVASGAPSAVTTSGENVRLIVTGIVTNVA